MGMVISDGKKAPETPSWRQRAWTAARRLDLRVVGPALALMLVGLLLIASASSRSGTAYHLIQARWAVVSLLASAVLIAIPYPQLLRLSPWLYLGGLGLLVAVKLVGPTINGSQRWLLLGSFRAQPSELMKLALVLLHARLLRFGRPLVDPRRTMLIIGLAGPPMLLVLVQPDLGTTLLFVPITLGIAWTGGLPRKHLLVLMVLGLVAVGAGYSVVLKPYQKERIRATWQYSGMGGAQRAGEGYQLHQSLLAVGNGGFWGEGWGQGTRIQAGRLPHRHNDFIFAVAGEEFGFLGSVVILGLLLGLGAGICAVARRTRDPAGRVICVGVACLVTAQGLIHIAVVTGVAPTTGMPFPLVSYGGSALLSTTASLALVLNVSLHRVSVAVRPAPASDRVI